MSQYWRSDIAVDKKHFELFRKKLVLPLLIHSTAAARKSEGLGSVNPIVSNHILSFLQRFHPPFSNPPRHTRTHTPEVWTPRLPSKEANISRTRPFSGETEKYFLMILGFTPFLTESLQMPMVCPGESCSTHVLIVLVGGLLRPHG